VVCKSQDGYLAQLYEFSECTIMLQIYFDQRKSRRSVAAFTVTNCCRRLKVDGTPTWLSWEDQVTSFPWHACRFP